MRIKLTAAAALLITLATTVPAAAQAGAPVPEAQIVLRPGDVIKVWVWRMDDWTGDYTIPESGMVTFARIGPRMVIGIPTAMLRDSLIEAYKQFLRDPAIEVTFKHRISILGAVKEPGLFLVDRTMNISEALTLAGGPEKEGKFDEVQLYRGGERIVTRIGQGTRIADLPLQSGDQLIVPQAHWFARNTTLVATILSGLISLTIALLVRN